ncbi:early transcription elongation factor of RNA pol II, NGN section-domain-containing protein [Gloeopeniophorella convolvens]|nr:early transcription elongation factor of RNA pol II, NGN section-domain-containing protein [Gloeopeniophorella convolvens]
MPRPDVLRFLDIAAIRAEEGEEDEDEEEEEDSDERGDENEDGLQQQMGPPPFNTASESRETLAAAECVAQRIRAYSVGRRDHHPEPSEVAPVISYGPSVDNPGLWTVRVKLQQEREVVSQILRRCLALGDRAPRVTSAFNREAIPGYVFIEAFTVQDVLRAVRDMVTVQRPSPRLVNVEDRPLTLQPSQVSSPVREGQWVQSLVGLYRGDVGFVYERSSQYDVDLVVAFVPWIRRRTDIQRTTSGHKRKRSARPSPGAVPSDVMQAEQGKRKVVMFSSDHFMFNGIEYKAGLVLWPVSSSHVQIAGTPPDITPFVRSAALRDLEIFAPYLKASVASTIRRDTRVQVKTGALQGTVGTVEVPLHDLCLYFLPGDAVKCRWTSGAGMVVTVDYENSAVVYFDKDLAVEVPLPMLAMEFEEIEKTLRPQHFRLGEWVEFINPMNFNHEICRGEIVEFLGTHVRVQEDVTRRLLKLDKGELTHSLKQGRVGRPFVKDHQNIAREGREALIIKGPFRGYLGTIANGNVDGANIQLEARVTAYASQARWEKWSNITLSPLKIKAVREAGREFFPEPRHTTPPPQMSAGQSESGVAITVSIDPRELRAWPPSIGHDVVVISGGWVGFIGKVVQKDGDVFVVRFPGVEDSPPIDQRFPSANLKSVITQTPLEHANLSRRSPHALCLKTRKTEHADFAVLQQVKLVPRWAT